MKIQKTMLAAALALASLASQASVTIGGADGYTFDDNAFATYAGSSGKFNIDGILPPPDNLKLPLSVSDKDVYTGLFNNSDKDTFIDLRFDSGIVNGTGDDFVLFDLGSIDRFYVTIGTQTVGKTSNQFSETDGLVTRLVVPGDGRATGLKQVNAVGVDLSLFGLAAGTVVTDIRVGMDWGYPKPELTNTKNLSRPTLTLAAALHTNAPAPVPEPETYAMLLAGLGAIGAAVRRRKQAK